MQVRSSSQSDATQTPTDHRLSPRLYARSGLKGNWQLDGSIQSKITAMAFAMAAEIEHDLISQRTLQLRLGLGVVVLPCNHPYRVVEYVSTLDIISDGRVEFGTGRGASAYHVEAFGCAPTDSKAMWEESLRVISSMFLDDPFPGWDGTYYRHLPPRDIVPKPIQKPHPPLWVAASKPDTFAEAARLGLGVIGVVRLGPEQLAPAIRAYQETIPACTPVGGVVNHQIGAFAICGIEKDYSVGRDIAGAASRWYFGDNQSPLQAHRFDSQEQLRLSNDQLIEQGIIIGGDADSVCRGIARWEQAGVDTLLLMLGAGNTTHEQVMRGLDILGDKVIPKFK